MVRGSRNVVGKWTSMASISTGCVGQKGLCGMTERSEPEGVGTAFASNGASPCDIREWDNRNLLHPWGTLGESAADRTIAARGEGIYLIDPEGRRYIDGPGGMWCMQIGYGRREMAEAIAEQALRLTYSSPWFFATEPSALLARRIAERAPAGFDRVFFTTGGSTAVDSAIRFAHFYHNLLGCPEKKLIVSRERSYHGSTYLAASVTGKERELSHLDTDGGLVRFLPDVNPGLRGPRRERRGLVPRESARSGECHPGSRNRNASAHSSRSRFSRRAGSSFRQAGITRRLWRSAANTTCSTFRTRFVTGFGRLGHWFASEDVFGIRPDILVCAKGLTSGYVPLGAMLLSSRLAERLEEAGGGEALFTNGFTYSGHPVSCAAALKNIEIIEREGILEHVRQVAPLFQERLQALRRHGIVRDARGIGLLGAVEGSAAPGMAETDRLDIDREFGMRMDSACEARGLIVRPLVNMCVFSPPLVIREAEIQRMFDILDDALGEVGPAMLRERDARSAQGD